MEEKIPFKGQGRLTFECWNCAKTYTLFKEITDQQEWIVGCPYCEQEAVVKLEPHKQSPLNVLRGNDPEGAEYVYHFPKVIPTEKRA